MPPRAPSNPPSRNEGALLPYLWAIRAHPLIIAVTLVIALVTGGVLVKERTAKYKATSEILITPVAEGGGNGTYVGLPIVSTSAADPARTLQTAATILQTPQAEALTARTLGGSWTAQRVSEAVKVEPRGESNIITVLASDPNAKAAARLVNVYTQSALSVRSTELGKVASSLIAQLQQREQGLSPSDVTTLSQFASQIAALVPISNGHDPNFSLLQSAAVPTSSSETSAKLIVLLAALAGLVIGMGAALVIEFLNRRVRDEDEALTIYPLPVLARVPPLPRGARGGASIRLMPPRVQEAFRTLQVQLPAGPPGRGRTMMLTSPSMGDGKTTSAINLALILAAADQQVILFDFDLRKPDVGNRLGLHADVLDLFRSHATLEDILIEAPEAHGLRVISTSPQGDVAPLLEAVSRRLPDLLAEAAQLADYVIVDTAPLGEVSDALRVASAVDDILLVVRPDNTDRTDLEHTRELLERMGHVVTGAIIVGESGGNASREYYGSPDRGKSAVGPNTRTPPVATRAGAGRGL